MQIHKPVISILLLYCLFPAIVVSQIKWEIKTGVNMSDITHTTSKTKIGPFIGMGCYYDISSKLTLVSGIELTTKGGNNIKSKEGYADQLKICDISLYYVQIPINIGYKLTLKEHITLLPQAGIYFAYGIWGYGELTAISFETEKNFRLYEDTWNPFHSRKWNDWSKTQIKAFNRFDSGICLRVDTQVYRFIFHLAYDMGLNAIWKGYQPTGFSIANRNFTIGIGYRFP